MLQPLYLKINLCVSYKNNTYENKTTFIVYAFKLLHPCTT